MTRRTGTDAAGVRVKSVRPLARLPTLMPDLVFLAAALAFFALAGGYAVLCDRL